MIHTQELQIPPHGALVIETPEGLVILRLSGGRRRFKIELPNGKLKVHRSVEVALKEARFVEDNGEGGFRPKYQALIPEMDYSGAISGLKRVEVVRP